MQLLYARGQALRQRGARLDQEQHLAPFLELPLPDVDRGDAGHDVHAGRQLLLHKRPRDPGGLAAVLAGGEADRLAHRVTGEIFRSRERTPGTIDRAPSISSSVLRAERLKRIEHFDSSAGTPIAWRTCDGFMLIEAQADPEETQTPAASSARIAASLSTPSTETFRTWGARRSGEPQTRTPPRPSSPARSFSRSPSTRSISSGDASVRAAASPAMPATFSVPARRSNSWPPPTRDRPGRRRSPERGSLASPGARGARRFQARSDARSSTSPDGRPGTAAPRPRPRWRARSTRSLRT